MIDLVNQLRIAAAWARQANEPDNSEMLDNAADEIERLRSQGDKKMIDEPNLHETTDAATWAREFCKRWPSALCQIPGKEGVSDGDDWEATMIGWFANAIMAGVDSHTKTTRE